MQDTGLIVLPRDVMYNALYGETISGLEYILDNDGNGIPVIFTKSGKIIYPYKGLLVCDTTKFAPRQIEKPIVLETIYK